MRINLKAALLAVIKKPLLIGAALCAFIAVLLWLPMLFGSNDKVVEEALLSGQRAEVALATGEVYGGIDNAPKGEEHKAVEHADKVEAPVQVKQAEATHEVAHSPATAAEAKVDGGEVATQNQEAAPHNQHEPEAGQKIEEKAPSAAEHTDATAADTNKAEAAGEGQEPAPELTQEELASVRKSLEERRKKLNISQDKASIVILITGVGLSESSTKQVLEMPVNFTLGFSPYAPDVGTWTKKAAILGFDTVLQIPMETPDYSVDDPGAYALLSTASAEDNISRLEMLLSLGVNYKAVYTAPEENFSTNMNNIRPIVTALADHNMPILYGRGQGNVSLLQFTEHLGVTLLGVDAVIDDKITYAAILKHLADLQRVAETSHYAIGIAHPYPLTLSTLKYWMKQIQDKDVQVVPVTLLVDQVKKEKAREKALAKQKLQGN